MSLFEMIEIIKMERPEVYGYLVGLGIVAGVIFAVLVLIELQPIIISIYEMITKEKVAPKNVKGVERFYKRKRNDENRAAKGTDNLINAENLYLTPVQLGFLYSFDIRYEQVIATILHYLELGYIKLTKLPKKDGVVSYRFEKNHEIYCDTHKVFKDGFLKIYPNVEEDLKKSGISKSEVFIIDRIVFKYYSYVNAERIYELYDAHDDYSKLYNSRPIDELQDLNLAYSNLRDMVVNELVDLGVFWKEPLRSPKVFRDSFGVHYCYNDVKNTLLGLAKSYQIRKYRDKLKNDTLLPERTIENVHLWGEHLINGVALGVCRTTIQDATDIYEGKRKK